MKGSLPALSSVLQFLAKVLSVIITPIAIGVSAHGMFKLMSGFMTRKCVDSRVPPDPAAWFSISLTGAEAWRLSLQVGGPMLLVLLLFDLSDWIDEGRDVVGLWAGCVALVLVWAQADTYFTGLRRSWMQYGRHVDGTTLKGFVDVPGSVYAALLLLTVVALVLFWQMRNELVAWVGLGVGPILLVCMALVSFYDGMLETDRGWSLGWWTVAAYAVGSIFAGFVGLSGRDTQWSD